MKMSLLARLLLLLGLLLPVVAPGAASAPRAHAADAINNDNSKIGVMTQEYAGDNIAEILMITYDGGQPALVPFNYKNPEIEALNRTIKLDHQQKYEDFMENNHDERTIEIKSYPFTSEDYLQIVMTSAVYPVYGTDGELSSYNFNKKENRYMDLADVMTKLGLDENTLTHRVRNLYVPTEPSQSVGAVAAAGFLIRQGPSGPINQLLLEVVIEQAGAEPWKHFFAYTPALNELIQLNPHCLFDPDDMDRMDPVLSYQRSVAGEAVKGLPEGQWLSFDTRGLEVIRPGCEYSLDGMVYFSLERMFPVSYDQGKVLAQIKAREGNDIRLITLTPSDEHAAILSYLTWLVVYDKGSNEDSRHCVDVYVHAEGADFRLHTSVPVDSATDYHDTIGSRLSTIFFTDYK